MAGFAHLQTNSDIDAAVDSLLHRVGERLRTRRKAMGMSRRALSEISGVSVRYLAQMEAGAGNMSVGLLMRVAMALDCRIDWLVAADDRRVEVRHGRICLVGLRGAGKSTLGRMAASELGLPFVELNERIEAACGMKIGDVMALYGPEGYRRLEADTLDQLLAGEGRFVLAVAGGIVAAPATYARLLEACHTVWVRASPLEHMDRVRAQGDERPMAGNPDAMAQLRAILADRVPHYERAHAQLDTSGRKVEQSAQALRALIAQRGFLG